VNVADPERMASARNFAPFAGAAVLAWISVPIGTSIDWTQYEIATALLVVAFASRIVGAHRLRVGLGRVLPSLAFLAALGLLRNSAGGISSGVGVVALVPVFYIALHSDSRRDLYALLVGMTVFYIAPIVIVGPPEYPQTQYRAALLTVAVSSIVGLAIQRLVAEVRRQAEQAREREQMLTEVSAAVRRLFSSEHVRLDVCAAAKRVGDASAAALYEPVAGTRTMRSSAFVGMDASDVSISMDRASAVMNAFASGESQLITEEVERHVGSPELWRAAGSPRSVLYEPLLKGAETIGVLVVGWPSEVRAGGARATVVELLAHEAAVVIARADKMDQLADMAETDPLTGLANRRAWDARMAQALEEDSQLTVAMLDLDHFKLYNDTHGHPAGDRLLKETAAAWREQLRTGDLLARLGGEEFGLLLINCDTAHAMEVVARLRGAVLSDQTCSVGCAARLPGEAADRVMARADAALYEAKTSGRDRVCVSA
jgi:diguanylate cyclase (GGDEF)-like protein